MSNGIEPIVVPEPIPEPIPKPIDVIRGKIFPANDHVVHYLSAQEYALMEDDEKQLVDIVLTEEGLRPNEYKKRMQALYPKKLQPKELKWRHR